MNKAEKLRVAKATVKLPGKGQGVLVPGNFILTVTHCIDVTYTGGAVLGDHLLEKAQAGRVNLLLRVCAAEPCCDIAVLEEPDNQVFFDESDIFDEFCEKTEPVPVCMAKLKAGEQYEVHIYTHKHEWMQGTGQVFGRAPRRMLHTVFPKSVESGTSGSPIVNQDGELVALLSNGGIESRNPLVSQALPVWVVETIRAEQEI